MENGVFWDIKPQFVPHRRHITSATELSRFMLCKILGFHGGIMENGVFWDIKPQFVPHRRHITSPLQSSAG
jgi:hypothetical protein